MVRMHEFSIDKVYYWDGEEVATEFQVKNIEDDVIATFNSYTKAERRIVEMLEKLYAPEIPK